MERKIAVLLMPGQGIEGTDERLFYQIDSRIRMAAPWLQQTNKIIAISSESSLIIDNDEVSAKEAEYLSEKLATLDAMRDLAWTVTSSYATSLYDGITPTEWERLQQVGLTEANFASASPEEFVTTWVPAILGAKLMSTAAAGGRKSAHVHLRRAWACRGLAYVQSAVSLAGLLPFATTDHAKFGGYPCIDLRGTLTSYAIRPTDLVVIMRKS